MFYIEDSSLNTLYQTLSLTSDKNILNSEATYVSLAQYIFDVVRLDSIDHSILN
jgi:hypothetical protein